jgi:NAD(P)-dependent dehydrogenase (short-subunit alcohol dehydrogenase family)
MGASKEVTFDFGGKVAWVTGAAKGMGQRHAERLAEAGAAVGCLDVDEEGIAAVVAAIESQGGRALAIPTDIGDWDSMSSAAAQLEESFGAADIVVANAAIMMEPIHLEETSIELWRRIVDVDLNGAFITAKAAVPQLRKGEGGSLVMISSVSGICGHPRFAAYNAAKHGVIGLTRTLANELGREGVRVNAVCPGWVDTPMLDDEAANLGMSREEAVEMWATQHLIPRLVQTDEISDAVLWLASDASAMVTGATLPVDGGLFEYRTDLVTLQGPLPG